MRVWGTTHNKDSSTFNKNCGYLRSIIGEHSSILMGFDSEYDSLTQRNPKWLFHGVIAYEVDYDQD